MLVLGEGVGDLEKTPHNEVGQVIDNTDKKIGPKELIEVVDG